jgi:5-oxoprolinase (ATP-hydrolysing)/N-methylhydantoinase B
MRFSDKGHYVEAYIKCANCGVLVYDEGVKTGHPGGKQEIYCSDWCRDWATLRASGDKRRMRLPLPRDY